MGRVMADCRRWPSETNCSLTIIGEEDEVVRAAAEHAASVHGHEDSPELREQLRGVLGAGRGLFKHAADTGATAELSRLRSR